MQISRTNFIYPALAGVVSLFSFVPAFAHGPLLLHPAVNPFLSTKQPNQFVRLLQAKQAQGFLAQQVALKHTQMIFSLPSQSGRINLAKQLGIQRSLTGAPELANSAFVPLILHQERLYLLQEKQAQLFYKEQALLKAKRAE